MTYLFPIISYLCGFRHIGAQRVIHSKLDSCCSEAMLLTKVRRDPHTDIVGKHHDKNGNTEMLTDYEDG